MTEEQIEAWKKREYVQTGYLGGWPLPNSEAAHGEPLVIWPKAIVFRLLDERKRLLEAMRPMVDATDTMTFRKAFYGAGLEGWLAQYDKARAAVAFAEASAEDAAEPQSNQFPQSLLKE